MLFFASIIGAILSGASAHVGVKTPLLQHKKVDVSFKLAEEIGAAVGEKYVRPSDPHPSMDSEKILASACGTSTQVHISLGNAPDSMVISFVSTSISGSVVFSQTSADTTSVSAASTTVKSVPFSYSNLRGLAGNLLNPSIGVPNYTPQQYMALKVLDTSSWAVDPVTSEKWPQYVKVTLNPSDTVAKQLSYIQGNLTVNNYAQILDYRNPYAFYDSAVIHTATLTGLTAGTTYYYQVVGSCYVYHFTVPSNTYPFTVGLIADVGITSASLASIHAVGALNPDVIVFPGDLCYADGTPEVWDTYGNLIEPTFANIPVILAGGNHELGSFENWMSYNARYPSPNQGSGSTNPCYYAVKAGPTTVITLCSYADFTSSSKQYAWLSNYLANGIDRVATPWVIVQSHVPMYSSNNGHYAEAELFRRSIEPLLYQYGVDVVVNGHVHAYERSIPVYNFTADPCGATHITIGDAGNYEGYYNIWNPTNMYNTTSLASGGGFSAFREASFGVAGMVIVNSTYATYSWNRHSCDSGGVASAANNYRINTTAAYCASLNDNGGYSMIVSDVAAIVRPDATTCPNKYGQTITPQTITKKTLRTAKTVLAEVAPAPALKFEFKDAEKHGLAVGLDYIRPEGASPNLPPRKVKLETATACASSEQIHITIGNDPTSMVVSFASADVTGTVYYASSKQDILTPSDNTKVATGGVGISGSELRYFNVLSAFPTLGTATSTIYTWANFMDTTAWAFDPVTGAHWNSYKKILDTSTDPTTKYTNTYNNLQLATYATVATGKVNTGVSPYLDYKNPYNYYDSPILHSVTLTGLTPGAKYYYRVLGSCRVYSFTVPPSTPTYPFTVGLFADVGVTVVSNLSINSMAAINPDVAILAGDMAYADGYPELWDTFGALMEPVFANIPLLTCNGNHEMNNGENWRQYSARYPTPYKASGSSSPLYWARAVGPTHVITLSSYSGFQSGSLQYNWLQNYLSTSINRTATPWVIAVLHVPMYTSNNDSIYEGELMRQSMEPLLYKYGVDIVVNGHIHAYERSLPVYNLTVDPCGATHITIGDSGNYEGSYAVWRDNNVQGKNGNAANGGWSAFKEGSFGVGSLKVMNATHAYLSWNRHSCDTITSSTLVGAANAANNYGANFSAANCVTPTDNGGFAMATSDQVWIVKPSISTCAAKFAPIVTSSPTSAPVSSPSSASGNGAPTSSSTSTSSTDIGLSVGLAVAGAVAVGLVAYFACFAGSSHTAIQLTN